MAQTKADVVALRVLGCSGSEAPEVKPCSFLLGRSVLIDAGSVASTLSIEEQRQIDHVYLSHAHLDHIKDLAFLAENVFADRKRPIVVYAHAEVIDKLKRHLFNEVVWPDFTRIPSPEKPVFRFEAIESDQPQPVPGLESIQIQSVEVNHPGPTLGFILHGPKMAVAYVGDTGPTDRIWQVIGSTRNVQALLVEASFPDRLESLAKQSQHLTPSGLQSEIAKLQQYTGEIFVYHIKTPYHDEIIEEINSLADARVKILAPGSTFELA